VAAPPGGYGDRRHWPPCLCRTLPPPAFTTRGGIKIPFQNLPKQVDPHPPAVKPWRQALLFPKPSDGRFEPIAPATHAGVELQCEQWGRGSIVLQERGHRCRPHIASEGELSL
jgi:hypothetical protein